MPIPQSTIDEIIKSEHQLVLDALAKYGEFYEHALKATAFLSRCVGSVDVGRQIFARFHSQVKKHHTLAIFSIVRLHQVQAMMDLRQVLEASACAAFAIRNPDPAHFVDIGENGLLDTPQSKTVRRYRWLDDHFPDGSSAIKGLKDLINQTAAHANFVNTANNFEHHEGDGWATANFFDAEDDHLIKTNLWLASNVAVGVADLLYGVASTTDGVVFREGFKNDLLNLNSQNQSLRDEMIASERYQRAMARQSNREAGPVE